MESLKFTNSVPYFQIRASKTMVGTAFQSSLENVSKEEDLELEECLRSEMKSGFEDENEGSTIRFWTLYRFQSVFHIRLRLT